jgi:hypothetical protein
MQPSILHHTQGSARVD